MKTAESSSRPLVILNPAANHGHMDPYRVLIRSFIKSEQAEYKETHGPEEAEQLAIHAAAEGRAIIAVGGDGTVNGVVNGILAAGRRVPLGIVPAGSGNDFACGTLKLPTDPAAAMECAFHGRLTDIDAGVVDGHYFANAFSVGLDADIAIAADQMKRYLPLSGSPLYYTATLRQLLFGYHRCPWLTFSLDQDTHVQASEKRYVLMAISNGPTYGAGFRVNPQADPADGLFDICVINYLSLLRALKLLPIIQRGEHDSVPEVTFYRARTVHIECRKPTNMQADGETTCATCFDAQILPGALWIRVGDAKK